MRILIMTLGAMLALPVRAEPVALDGAGFEANVAGNTIEFRSGGQAYGAEQYLPGRRVIWAFEGGPCREGTWSEPEPEVICFSYDHDPGPQCWTFFDEGGRLRARLVGADPLADLVESRRGRAPLTCPGPDVGS